MASNPHETPTELLDLLIAIDDQATTRHHDAGADETFIECRVCGTWEGHTDTCPVPAITRWLAEPPPGIDEPEDVTIGHAPIADAEDDDGEPMPPDPTPLAEDYPGQHITGPADAPPTRRRRGAGRGQLRDRRRPR